MAVSPAPFWNRSTFLVITGASRGIGKQIAIKFGSLLTSNSTVVLLARSLQDLEETRKELLAVNPALSVKVHNVDLSKPVSQEFDSILLSAAPGKQFELNLLVHNAGTILTDVPASKMDNVQQFNEYMTTNLYSVTSLTASFLKIFKQGEQCIVNITSIYAVQPGKGVAHYCIGKASREMYFKVLAEENPELNILSYSPGPVDTNMFRQIAKDCWHEDAKKMGQTLLANKTTVKMEDTVQKLVDTLSSRSYPNAGRIDFYDRD